MLKKLLSIILAVGMISSLSGCSSMESAETSATNYLNAVKTQDLETISKYRGEEVTAEESTDDFTQYMVDSLLENMTFEIVSSEENDDTATVTASISNVNMTVVISEMLANSISLLFSDASEEDLNTAMQGFFITSFEKHIEDLVTKEVAIDMTKGEGYWIVNPSDELMDAICGGMYTAIDNAG